MIKLIVGRQTDSVQDKMLKEAITNYQANPEVSTFVIVPNHIKFTTEVKAIKQLACKQGREQTAVKNLQVLSFSRLAWFFLKDAPAGLPTQLDDAAAAMLLAKIIEAHRQELILFQQVDVNSGLVKQLYRTILAIYEGNIHLDELSTQQLDLETKNKIHDLKIIYDSFSKTIADRFSTKNEVQLALNRLLVRRKDLKTMSFYFCDFSHFSMQETVTLKLLAQKAKILELCVKTRTGELNPNAKAGSYDFVIQKTLKRLTTFFKRHRLTYQVKKFPVKRQSPQELLNHFWAGILSSDPQIQKQVQLVKADSRYAEAYYVAHTIYQQVALKHYRYRDFLVLAPDLHEYETYLLPILRQNKIPFFNDLQQEMKYHPLVVLIENLAQLLKRPWQRQNILTILKTRLLIPDWYPNQTAYLNDVDQLENFSLAHGINHNLWKESLPKFLNAELIRLDQMPEIVARLDKLRRFIVEQISKLFSKLKSQQNSRKAVTIFFNFLIKNKVPHRLGQWRRQANKAGDLQQAQQPEQVWDLLIKLLKDYLLINPRKFDLNSFFSMLISGFQEANFSQIPSTLDAVNLSEIGMVQSPDYQQVFIIGATSTNLPKIQKTPGFLSSENLASLQPTFQSDSYLEDTQKLNNLDQNYQFGLALALGQNHVYLSYPVLNAANERLKPSIFFERLKEAGAPEFSQHDLPTSSKGVLSFLTNASASLGYLMYLNKINPDKQVKQLLALSQRVVPNQMTTVMKASHFNNQPEDIGPVLAQKLYGQNLDASVSQLETFYQNSYEYFLKYGLRLRDRFESRLDVIQAGNYFHETFDRLVKELRRKHLDLASLNAHQLDQLLRQARQQMGKEAQYTQLRNEPFNRYLFDCLNRTTSRVAYYWQQSLKQTRFRAKYSELSFGDGEKIKGLKLKVPDLAGHRQIFLRGKIDRVDLATMGSASKILAQVIDYKSSPKKFDLASFLNGLTLQIVSYLDVLAKNQSFFAGKDKLALLGAFYQTVTRQVQRLNSKSLINQKLEIKREDLVGKQKLRYTGVIANDLNLLKEAQPLLLDQNSKFTVYQGLKVTKSGKIFLAKDCSFSDQELKLLLGYNEFLIRHAGQDILAGHLKLNPYQRGKGKKNALTYSVYRDIFFFDAMLRQNQYHEIKQIDKKTFLKVIQQRLEKGSNN